MAAAKILIVEDQLITAQAIADQLTRLGYAVVDIVHSGTDALTKTAETQPDLVLMDIVLKKGDADGVGAANQIREQFQIPVVYLTAYSDQDILERAKVTEPFGYVIKPFSERDLRIAVEIALYKHSMEQQLARREKLLSTILESVNNAVVATDAGGTVTYINPEALALTGWQLNEALGQPIAEVVSIVEEASQTPLEHPVRCLLQATDEAQRQDVGLLVARDGSMTPICSSTSLMRPNAGAVEGAVLVFWDLSEQRRAQTLALEQVKLATEIAERQRSEAEVRKILAAEQALNELKSRLVSTISHEYRTPLAVILTSTELLKRYSDRLSDEKKDTYLSRIQAAVRQLSLLVEEVLTFGKAEAGELPFHPVPLDVVEFCDRLTQEQRLLASDRHVIEFTSEFPELQAQLDEQLMHHILINLLSNAIKYSPKGGLVEVSLRQGDCIILQVRDRGIGIPAADQPYLFGHFFRASNVGSIPGTGMGLSIVKKCVELHEGEIAINSEEAVGTTVIVTLPVNRKPI